MYPLIIKHLLHLHNWTVCLDTRKISKNTIFVNKRNSGEKNKNILF